MRYAFVGLGNLGGHLAASLAGAGFALTVHDRDDAHRARFDALGVTWADSAAEAARDADAVITCLPSPAVSEVVLAQILPAMRPGADWIETSTLGREEILRLAATAQAAGMGVLESPVTGGVHLAAQGQITVLVGGDEALFQRHSAALQAMGGRLFHMGPLGSAALIKVITNMLAFIHLVADGEALMLAKRGGLDLKTAWEAITASSGTSFVHETEGQLILNGSYDIAFTMDLALKDLGFAMRFGREFGVPLDLASMTEQTFLKGRAAYGGGAQSTQIVKLLEDVLGTDLRAEGFPARLT
ncbi:MAG: NAD(P)-dependent oxidoreductase [Rhodobacter sp.]|uniref:NAD(P)-dependent oxidoreductase n=1 Tax=Pararhodobacter sp. TaxID=2127056 RepID=UPI001DE8D96E|nr:NAD(P)-dependent oxidoreductase [Pararhodobacter sp.]MCB1344048.1 NAD(P)-dependent oxidoreductase [Paracoccaceae bacterium]MCC0074726.1 NAD(P)-dependent oxidoreductase [Rhodobacter sp.]HPD92306.1 NAD(P)-dependent oxidoreductase [Pararhodobacter sp.]